MPSKHKTHKKSTMTHRVCPFVETYNDKCIASLEATHYPRDFHIGQSDGQRVASNEAKKNGSGVSTNGLTRRVIAPAQVPDISITRFILFIAYFSFIPLHT